MQMLGNLVDLWQALQVVWHSKSSWNLVVVELTPVLCYSKVNAICHEQGLVYMLHDCIIFSKLSPSSPGTWWSINHPITCQVTSLLPTILRTLT